MVPTLPDSFEKIYTMLVRLLNGVLGGPRGATEVERDFITRRVVVWC